MTESKLAEPVVQAFKACLDPETDAHPTPQQKQAVLDSIAAFGFLRRPMLDQLERCEGMRQCALFIHEQAGADPYSLRPRKAQR